MNSQNHNLDDETFTRLLSQPAEAVNDADAEVVALRSALRSYRTETLQWAERRSSTQPSLRPAARRSRVWAAVPQWSLAAVAVISIAAGAVHVYDRPDAGEETTAAADVTPAGSAARTSEADIAADNELLSSIDQALSYRVASPVDRLELKSAHSTKTSASGLTD